MNKTISSGERLHDKSLNFVTGRLKPTEDWLVLKPLPPHLSQTIAADWNGEAVRGQVVAAGPGKYPNIHTKGFKDGKQFRTVKKSTQFVPTEVKPGDVVQLGGMEIGGYLWKKIIIDGIDHIWCMEADVCFVED